MACDTTHVPALPLSLDDLRARLAVIGADEVAPLAGGASSLTYSALLDRGRVVVKVAPPGLAPVRNRDVLRQARLLRALETTVVPVPTVVWEDAGDPPGVPPLFVMTYVEGSSLEPLFDVAGADPAPVLADRVRNAARTLVDLHAVDPSAIGLADDPLVDVASEIDRWCDLLETVDPTLAPDWQRVGDALRASIPPTGTSAVVHGDFRLGNLLAVGPDVTSIIDWEIWTIGDPRVDLGWFLANADPSTYKRATAYSGRLPAPDELLGVYADAVGRDVPDVEWFRALACFKSTATWSLIVKHNRRRAEPDAAVEAMVATLPDLLDQAHAFLR
jgi:aminoglycoside phosphotransferase (APT) family kinase protein